MKEMFNRRSYVLLPLLLVLLLAVGCLAGCGGQPVEPEANAPVIETISGSWLRCRDWTNTQGWIGIPARTDADYTLFSFGENGVLDATVYANGAVTAAQNGTYSCDNDVLTMTIGEGSVMSIASISDGVLALGPVELAEEDASTFVRGGEGEGLIGTWSYEGMPTITIAKDNMTVMLDYALGTEAELIAMIRHYNEALSEEQLSEILAQPNSYRETIAESLFMLNTDDMADAPYSIRRFNVNGEDGAELCCLQLLLTFGYSDTGLALIPKQEYALSIGDGCGMCYFYEQVDDTLSVWQAQMLFVRA